MIIIGCWHWEVTDQKKRVNDADAKAKRKGWMSSLWFKVLLARLLEPILPPYRFHLERVKQRVAISQSPRQRFWVHLVLCVKIGPRDITSACVF